MIVLQKLKDKDYQEWIQLNEFKEVKGVPPWASLRMDARADTAVGQVSLTPSEGVSDVNNVVNSDVNSDVNKHTHSDDDNSSSSVARTRGFRELFFFFK